MFSSRLLIRNYVRNVSCIRALVNPVSKVGLVNSNRFYSSKGHFRDQTPKIRYLFYVFIFSSGLLYFVGKKVEKKQPKTSFTEREFQEYEQSTGLKRRHKLINLDQSEKYKFYVLPYVHRDETVQKITEKLNDKEVKVIDPQDLIKRELEDESRKYSYLLQDLKASGKSFPSGLITALIKEEIKFYLNTTRGTYDTNFIIKNYPQTTDEAIKFENDISEIQKSIVLHYDMLNELPKEKKPDEVRSVNNVVGYFETVGKSKTITSNQDEMDDILQEIVLEDL